MKKEGNETVTNCNALKLRAADGKMRLTDVADQVVFSRQRYSDEWFSELFREKISPGRPKGSKNKKTLLLEAKHAKRGRKKDREKDNTPKGGST